MNPTDFLFDPLTGDLLMTGQDLVVGDSTRQHQFDLMMADKGHYKHQPLRGVGLRNHLNEEGSMPGLTATVRAELMADGQTVEVVKLESGQLSITATATY